MNPVARSLILTAFAVLAAGPAAADRGAVYADGRIGPVAELSPEERVWFQERWQELSPREREQMRRTLRREWSDLPPEARQKRREVLMKGLEERRETRSRRERDDHEPEEGYGQGYGTRDWDDHEAAGNRRGRR